MRNMPALPYSGAKIRADYPALRFHAGGVGIKPSDASFAPRFQWPKKAPPADYVP